MKRDTHGANFQLHFIVPLCEPYKPHKEWPRMCKQKRLNARRCDGQNNQFLFGERKRGLAHIYLQHVIFDTLSSTHLSVTHLSCRSLLISRPWSCISWSSVNWGPISLVSPGLSGTQQIYRECPLHDNHWISVISWKSRAAKYLAEQQRSQTLKSRLGRNC